MSYFAVNMNNNMVIDIIIEFTIGLLIKISLRLLLIVFGIYLWFGAAVTMVTHNRTVLGLISSIVLKPGKSDFAALPLSLLFFIDIHWRSLLKHHLTIIQISSKYHPSIIQVSSKTSSRIIQEIHPEFIQDHPGWILDEGWIILEPMNICKYSDDETFSWFFSIHAETNKQTLI